MHSAIFYVALAHSIYYGLTGIWPIVSIRSFIAVTGPKRDIWLVRTVGLLIIAITVPIAVAAARNSYPPEVLALALSAAVVLTLVDVFYVLTKTIPPIYLGDAVLEIVLIIAWVICWR